MKKILGTIMLCLLVGSLSAQSVWTGNAAVGTSGDFPGESAVLRAASNSFPSGTELMVTNPRGGQSVEVTITGRLETPGVFILIERAAATAIDLPTDHVLPVRVTPLKAERALSPTATVTETDPLSDDSDYNPAVTLKDDLGEVRTAPAPETVEEAPVVVVPETVTPPEEPEESEEPVDTETIFVYDLSTDDEPEEPETLESEPIVETEELSEPPVETPDDSSEDDRVVYFLTPSDLKPPPAAEETVPPASSKDDKVVKESVPVQPTTPAAARVETSVPVDLSTSLTMMPPNDTRSYIQIGAYRNQAVLESTAGRLMRDAPEYPLSYTVDTNAASPVYKLLMGLLRPAEKGVVLENARSTAFPDAFLLPK